MSQLTYAQYSTLVLEAIGAPVTQNNISKLSAVGVAEGKHGNFNIMNWVLKAVGSTDFNSIGVQNYPNPALGVQMTVQGLNQANMAAVKSNLLNDASFNDFTMSMAQFYSSWGGHYPAPSQQSAINAFDQPLEGNATDSQLQDATTYATKYAHGQGPSTDQVGNPLPGALDSGITKGVDAVGNLLNPFKNILDAVTTIWGALTNAQNWINIAKVLGGGALVIMGLFMFASSLGVNPSISKMMA